MVCIHGFFFGRYIPNPLLVDSSEGLLGSSRPEEVMVDEVDHSCQDPGEYKDDVEALGSDTGAPNW